MPLGVRLATGVAVLVAGGVHLWLWWRGATGTRPAWSGRRSSPMRCCRRSSACSSWRAVTGAPPGRAAPSPPPPSLGYLAARTVGLSGFIETRWTHASVLAAGCEALVLVLLVTEALVPDPGATARPGGP